MTTTNTHPNAFDGLDIEPVWVAVANAFEDCTAQGMDVWTATRAVCDMINSLSA
jgi:hypothetical protein